MNNQRLPRVEVSVHAIDRLSERCLQVWIEKGKEDGIGLMSFFITKSREAYALLLSLLTESSIEVSSCKVSYEGITYVFSTENRMTKLVTAYLTN